MNVYRSNTTCSLRGLKNVDISTLKSFKNGKALIRSTPDLDDSGVKIIMYNTSKTSKSFQSEMTRLGFTKVSSYTGNSDSTIHSWIARKSDIIKAK